MKLIISSSELLRGVMAVAKAIPAKSPLPILENFLFNLKGTKCSEFAFLKADYLIYEDILIIGKLCKSARARLEVFRFCIRNYFYAHSEVHGKCRDAYTRAYGVEIGI